MADSITVLQPIRRLGIATNVTLQLLAAALLLAGINYLSHRHYWRWDLTRNRDYTVSEQTRSFLKSLRGKTGIVAAFPRGSQEEREVRALLDEYRRHAKSHLAIEFIDLSGEPSRAIELGRTHNVALNRNGILVSKDRAPKPKTPIAPTAAPTTAPTTAPPATPTKPTRRTRFLGHEELFSYDTKFTPRRLTEFRGEDLLTSALLNVNQKTAPVIYLLSSHAGNLPSVAAPDGGRTAENVLLDIANKQGLELRKLSLVGRTDVPPDASALVSIRPTVNFTDREMALLREFWDQRKGAGLMFLLDPDASTSRLDVFLSENGATPRSDRILKVLTTAQGPRKELEVEAAFNPNSPITSTFGGQAIILSEQSESLRLETDPARLRAANLDVVPLLAARSDYWGEIKFYEDEPRRDDGDAGDPDLVVIAASIEKGAQRDQRLGAFSSRMVVAGNASLLDPDRESGRASPLGYDLVSSSLNWILNREELIGITAKRTESYHIKLGSSATAKILLLCLGLLPGAVFMFALFMWSVRRA